MLVVRILTSGSTVSVVRVQRVGPVPRLVLVGAEGDSFCDTSPACVSEVGAGPTRRSPSGRTHGDYLGRHRDDRYSETCSLKSIDLDPHKGHTGGTRTPMTLQFTSCLGLREPF